ncbi:hypothetical protein DZC34_18835 [Clostridium botulinum]|nr:hypothetical protein DZC34_18835 [Clostridium botulinum]
MNLFIFYLIITPNESIYFLFIINLYYLLSSCYWRKLKKVFQNKNSLNSNIVNINNTCNKHINEL